MHKERVYMYGDNSYKYPWILPSNLPSSIKELIVQEKYNEFVKTASINTAWEYKEDLLIKVFNFLYYPLGVYY